MKKVLFILMMFSAYIGASQDNTAYIIESWERLEAKRAFVLGADTLFNTTQINVDDTTLVTLGYLNQHGIEGNYIENQNAAAQTANMWISGQVRAANLYSRRYDGGIGLDINGGSGEFYGANIASFKDFNNNNVAAISGVGKVFGRDFVSTVAPGTAPLTVESTTLVANLNADLLDGQHGTFYQTALNGIGFVKANGTVISYDNSSFALYNHNHSGDYEVPLTFSTGLNRTGNTITNTITQYTDALARNAISLTTTGNSGAATYTPATGVFNIPNYTLAGLGYTAPDLSGYKLKSDSTGTDGYVRRDRLTSSLNTKENAFTKNTAFNKNFGTTAGTVLEGRTFGTAAASNVGDFEPAITGGSAFQYIRGDKTLRTLNTLAVPESGNLYFTDTRARDAISLTTTGTTGAATYTPATGVFNIPNYTKTINGLPQMEGNLIVDGDWFPIHDTNLGTENKVLMSGLKTYLNAMSDPMTTRGDIIYRNSSNVTARLPLGTNGQVLTSNGSDLYYATPATPPLYSLPLAANGTRGGLQIGYTETANTFALKLLSEKGYVELPYASSATKGISSFSSTNFGTSFGYVTLANAGISYNHLDNATISGLTAVNDGITDTDELMINYGGMLRKTDVSVLGDYMQNYLNFSAGSNFFTDAGTYTYLTSTTDRLLVGFDTDYQTGYKFVVGKTGNNSIYSAGNIAVENPYNFLVGTATFNESAITIKESSSQATTTSHGKYWVHTNGKPYFTNQSGVVYDLTNVESNQVNWKSGITTKNITDASTTQTIAHGLGRVPRFVRIKGAVIITSAIFMECEGTFDGTNNIGFAKAWGEGTSTAVTEAIYTSTSIALGFAPTVETNVFTGANRQTGVISVDATNITITWTKTGTVGSLVASLKWECN